MPGENNSDATNESDSPPTRLIAIHNFPKEQPQDLPLVKGTLYLGSYLKDEWWVGMDPETGQEGCFPANFVADEGSEAADKAIARVKAKARKAKERAAAAAAAAAAADVDPAGAGAEEKEFDTVNLEITDGVEDDVNDGSGEGMTSGEAAAAAAAATAAVANTAEMHADSKLRNLKSMIIIRSIKWFVSLLTFSCVAGSNYHLLNLDQENAAETVFKTGLWRVKSAVSFTIAWGVFMWLFEGCLAAFFIAWREGYVDPTLNNRFDINNLSIVLFVYDMLSFFLIVIAGFNMGAAAGIPDTAVELLLRQDGREGQWVTLNCTAGQTTEKKQYVEFPAAGLGNSTEEGATYQNLATGPLTAGVFLLIVLVHLVVLSLIQDYLWILTDYHGQSSPSPDMSSKAAGADTKKKEADEQPAETDDKDVIAEAEEDEENDVNEEEQEDKE